MCIIGMDIHRAFTEAVAWQDGGLRRLGRVDMRHDPLDAFVASLAMCRSVNNCVLGKDCPAEARLEGSSILRLQSGDLLCLQRTITGCLRIRAAAVPADDRDRRMIPKPHRVNAVVVQYVR